MNRRELGKRLAALGAALGIGTTLKPAGAAEVEEAPAWAEPFDEIVSFPRLDHVYGTDNKITWLPTEGLRSYRADQKRTVEGWCAHELDIGTYAETIVELEYVGVDFLSPMPLLGMVGLKHDSIGTVIGRVDAIEVTGHLRDATRQKVVIRHAKIEDAR